MAVRVKLGLLISNVLLGSDGKSKRSFCGPQGHIPAWDQAFPNQMQSSK